jgi:hypothetical protein
MTTIDTADRLTDAVEKFQKENALDFLPGRKQIFINDLKRSIQVVGSGQFRNSKGARIDLDTYLDALVESGNYTRTKPSTKLRYQPVFAVRTDGAKTAHRKHTESYLRKALQLAGYVFNDGATEPIIDQIAKSFIVSDDPEKGLTFSVIADTAVGSLPGMDRFSLDEVLNATGASRFVDSQATNISRLQHRATLRATAVAMAETGANSKTIERLVDSLAAYEKRALKTGKVIPPIDRARVQDEFFKYAEINGQDRSSAVSTARLAVQNIDDLTDIQGEVRKIVVAKEVTEYNFNENE